MLRARDNGQVLRERGRLPAARPRPVVREAARARARTARRPAPATPAKPAFSAADRRDRGRLPPRSDGQPALVAGAARGGAEPARRHDLDGRDAPHVSGIALQLDRLFESDAALDPLRAVIAAKPAAPFGAVAQAQLQLGQALDRLGYRNDAVAAYRAALAATPPADPLKIAERARAGLRTSPNAMQATAYRLSLAGMACARARRRGRGGTRADAVAGAAAQRPGDAVPPGSRAAGAEERRRRDDRARGDRTRSRGRAADDLRLRLRRRRAHARATRLDARARSSCTRRRARSSAPIASPRTPRSARSTRLAASSQTR